MLMFPSIDPCCSQLGSGELLFEVGVVNTEDTDLVKVIYLSSHECSAMDESSISTSPIQGSCEEWVSTDGG